MSTEAAMSNVPRTVASLEFATILFILKGERCLRISSAPTRPLFPCSRTDILPTTTVVSLVGGREGPSVSQSVSPKKISTPYCKRISSSSSSMRFASDCHGRLDYFFIPDGFVGRGRTDGRTDARRSSAGRRTRARPGEQEGNVHVD